MKTSLKLMRIVKSNSKLTYFVFRELCNFCHGYLCRAIEFLCVLEQIVFPLVIMDLFLDIYKDSSNNYQFKFDS